MISQQWNAIQQVMRRTTNTKPTKTTTKPKAKAPKKLKIAELKKIMGMGGRGTRGSVDPFN